MTIFVCLDNLKVDGRMDVGYESAVGVLLFNISAYFYQGHLDFMALKMIRQRFVLIVNQPVFWLHNCLMLCMLLFGVIKS